ncbi:MAG: peptidoglycan recognition protein family protein [Thiovulaceae bacterium]|nr:peptidoglycan recognition protein family protein [Sulfurimonadaceae bacterium]
MKYILLITIALYAYAQNIIETPIKFSDHRVELTKSYIKAHYGIDSKDIKIVPKIILIHHTAIDSFEESLSRFMEEELPNLRADISSAGAVNVSTHFMVESDGTIHQLMPLDFMARHVIGLNYNSIGIENVGGADGVNNLTEAQLKSNIFLVKYLKNKFDSIEYLVGHYEYRCFENDELWLERDAGYRTQKNDPHPSFMDKLSKYFTSLKRAPCDN